MKIEINPGIGITLAQRYYIYNAFVQLDDDQDGVPNCNDKCPNGNDSIDNNGNGIPDCAEGCSAINDKSPILDTDGDGIPASVIDQIDTDHNGVIDANVATGNNGIADVLETSPDSGIMKYPLKNTDGDDKPDFIDLKSNNVDFDLYVIGKDNLDVLGGGFISTMMRMQMEFRRL